MENKCKECYRCLHFIRYYTKGVKKFSETKFGWCSKKLTNVSLHESCDDWKLKPKRKKAKYGLRHCLSGLLTEISELRKMVEEDLNEDKNL